VRTTNLPSDFITHVFTADEVTGRLYAAGSWGTSPMHYELKYSDDHGFTWNTASAATPFIGTNAGNTQQLITAIYAHDPTIYIALENNKATSAPDVVGSTTGLANLAYDTVGLPTNAAGAVNGTRFLDYQGKLALSLNVIDVYLKDVPNAVFGVQTSGRSVSLYPNPCRDALHISGNSAVKEIRVMDLAGRVLQHVAGSATTVDVSGLQPGMYLLQTVDDHAVVDVQRFVKE